MGIALFRVLIRVRVCGMKTLNRAMPMGKTEIWAALKAAVDAATREDQALAQAILDGAGISLPGGSLVECYDELGTRYSIPVYCLSLPINLVVEGAGDRDSPAKFSEPVELEEGVELKS